MKKTALTAVFAAVWSLSAFCQTVPGLAEIRCAPDRSRNYVIETVVRKSGVTDTAEVNALGAQDAMRTVTYHDGLGYPVQTIQIGAGFRADARAATERFYSAGLDGMPGDSHPYSETVYEGSLLGRVLEQGYPGTVWQPSGSRTDSTGRTTVTEWGTCTASGADAVRGPSGAPHGEEPGLGIGPHRDRRCLHGHGRPCRA